MSKLGKYVSGLMMLVSVSAGASFVETYPELQKFLFEEPRTQFKFGFGLSPISVLQNRVYFTGNIFQVHWISKNFDIEVFSGSVGMTSSKSEYAGSKNFTFRFSPKVKLLSYLSVGPIVGIEFVSFPDIMVRQAKDNLFTPVEPFSSQGMIYGVMFSETIRFGKDFLLKVNQSIYKQTYSTRETSFGWRYVFDEEDIELDPEREVIKPSWVFMLEFSLLY